MAAGKAFFACRCGACCIGLCDPTIRRRAECLCCDCRQRGLIAASKHPENVLPAAIADYERGCDLIYFSNALRVDDASRALLEFSRLRDDSMTVTASAACCGSFMCTTHPLYGGCSIAVHADSCRVTVPHMRPIEAVYWGADFPADKYEARKRRDAIPKSFNTHDEIDTPLIQAFVAAVQDPIDPQYQADGCVTFEALCNGRAVKVDNAFYDESRAGKRR